MSTTNCSLRSSNESKTVFPPSASWRRRSQAWKPVASRHQPDLVICAHIHEAPFEKYLGGHWHCRIGHTLLVNAGQWRERRWPCHVQIEGDIVTWRAPGHPRESVRIRE